MKIEELNILIKECIKEVLEAYPTPNDTGISSDPISMDMGSQEEPQSAADMEREKRKSRIEINKARKAKEAELRNKDKENRGREKWWKQEKRNLRTTIDGLRSQESQI